MAHREFNRENVVYTGGSALENSTRLEYPRLKYSAVKLAANASDDYIHRSSLLYGTEYKPDENLRAQA